MALVDDREAPDYVPTTNELDNVEDPDLNQHGLSIDRYLAFGTTPRALPNPPRDGEVVIYKVKVECVGQAHKRRSDGEIRYRSELEILSVARVDEDLPPDYEKPSAKKKTKAQQEAEAEAAAADDQPPLFEDEPESLGDIADELLGEELADAAGADDDSNVVEFEGRPPFSDSEA